MCSAPDLALDFCYENSSSGNLMLLAGDDYGAPNEVSGIMFLLEGIYYISRAINVLKGVDFELFFAFVEIN